MSNEFRLGHDQQFAYNRAVEWYRSGEFIRKQIFVIGGYAGSGKSTMLNSILAAIGIPYYKIAYVTFTGKAAVVLRNKGLPAITIHKLIYNVSVTSKGTPIFRLKSALPSNIELIVVDEVGMVPANMMEDLLSFSVPILATGDPGQLPPIFGENPYIVNPDCMLTEVYRQSNDSGVLKCATDIRNGINPYVAEYDNCVQFTTLDKLNMDDWYNYDQILCATNYTKDKLNVLIRNKKQCNSFLPVPGDKLVCTRNNFVETYPGVKGVEMSLVNGLPLTCIDFPQSILGNENSGVLKFASDYIITPKGGNTAYFTLTPFKELYLGSWSKPDAMEDTSTEHAKIEHGRAINEFDYGYAITVHKSQGSEWNNVLVLDDCFYADETDKYYRWLYTAVTRAREKITVAKV